jgi:hypothetical protein
MRHPGGLVRRGYCSTYRDGWPHLDGGAWWTADILYRTALALNDTALKQAVLDMIRHDLDVKLDLDRMSYPPCGTTWNRKSPADLRHRHEHRRPRHPRRQSGHRQGDWLCRQYGTRL